MKVLEYLQNHTLVDLQQDFGIKVKEYDNGLVVLNYDQINSPKFHPIVKECRGLIIDIDTLDPVSRTFERFYNLNENPDDMFLPNKLYRIEEKADGSLISVYWYDNKWNVATRGSAYAEGQTASGFTYRDIFVNAIGGDIDDFMKDQFRDYSYTFELCSILNKVIKLYKETTVYLLNAVKVSNGVNRDAEVLNYIAVELGVKRPTLYKIDMDDIESTFDDFPATEEGYVLIDLFGNRVKVKNPAYVNLHHLKGNGEITPKRIADVVFKGETEEVLEYFPEYMDIFEPYQKAYDELVKNINKDWELLSKLDLDQKQFALSISHLFYKGILFSLRKGLTLDESFGKIGKTGKVGLLDPIVKFMKEKYNG